MPPKPKEFDRPTSKLVRDGLVGHVVQAALGVGVVEIDGGRKLLVDERQHGDAGFESAGAAEQMAGHGLGAADLELVAQGVLAEDQLNGARFVAVAGRGGGGVGVDVAHLFRLDARVFERGPHAALRALRPPERCPSCDRRRRSCRSR